MKFSRLFFIFFFNCLCSFTANSLAGLPSVAQQPEGFADNVGGQEFEELMKQLSTMSEEELKAYEQQLRASMSPEELAEVDRMQEQILRDMGFDQKTIDEMRAQQAGTTAPEASTTAATTPTTQEEKQEKLILTVPSDHSPEEIAQMLKHLLRHLHELRKKATIRHTATKRLVQWIEVLSDLTYYLEVINKPIHHKLLASQESKNLFISINNLHNTLRKYEPLFVVENPLESALIDDEADEEDPYEILGVSFDASQEEIDETYEILAATKDPKKVEAQLRSQKLSEKDIQRGTKRARDTFAIITDAYEQLSDKKLRTQIDRAISAKLESQRAQLNASQKALSALLETLNSEVYDKQLLKTLEKFLQQYAPKELAQKKEMEAAEAARKKEQEAARKIQPTKHMQMYREPSFPTPTPQRASTPVGNYPNQYQDTGYHKDRHEESSTIPEKKEERKNAANAAPSEAPKDTKAKPEDLLKLQERKDKETQAKADALKDKETQEKIETDMKKALASLKHTKNQGLTTTLQTIADFMALKNPKEIAKAIKKITKLLTELAENEFSDDDKIPLESILKALKSKIATLKPSEEVSDLDTACRDLLKALKPTKHKKSALIEEVTSEEAQVLFEITQQLQLTTEAHKANDESKLTAAAKRMEQLLETNKELMQSEKMQTSTEALKRALTSLDLPHLAHILES